MIFAIKSVMWDFFIPLKNMIYINMYLAFTSSQHRRFDIKEQQFCDQCVNI